MSNQATNLIASARDGATNSSKPVLEVSGLKKYFTMRSGLLGRRVQVRKAVDDVNFSVRQGEVLGLVGESGCGKTTTGLCVLRGLEPTAGAIQMHVDDDTVDMMKLDKEALRVFRRHAQLIFQDPYASLNPRMTVYDCITEPLKAHGITDRRELEQRSFALMELVGLAPNYLRRYPHAFSGGQRQRIGIARALALNPKLIVADEPVSALDVSVQAQIINLLKDLQEQLGIAFLFISHDLGVVKHTCDRIAVMYAGKIVEEGPTDEIYAHPLHPYTEALLSSVPRPDPRYRDAEIVLSGEVPDPAKLPTGCPFHPRCAYAEARCREEVPTLQTLQTGHRVACLRAAALSLAGI
ncbi:MAG: ABC transporter ATP-binding protein [Caldilineaceae bacterium]|nr:ABC transporter ATP-binding protein [Caldilineaceae bacterium]